MTSAMAATTFFTRTYLHHDDISSLARLVAGLEQFSAREVDVVRELAELGQTRGTASGYHFSLAEDDSGLMGFTCCGPDACADGAWLLYWIAVSQRCWGTGVSSSLLEAVERTAKEHKARAIFLETSSSAPYERARAFYIANGYGIEAVVHDYYRNGDHKIIFSKRLK